VEKIVSELGLAKNAEVEALKKKVEDMEKKQ